MGKNRFLFDKAYKFSIRIVNAYKHISSEKKEFVLSKQLLRCGTSIGANIAEAEGGISNNDFSAKLSIAYKECLETKYWLSLMIDTGFLEEKVFTSIYEDADELGKLLFSVIKKMRLNKPKVIND